MFRRIPPVVRIAMPQIVEQMAPGITEILAINIDAKSWCHVVCAKAHLTDRGIVSLCISLPRKPIGRSLSPLELADLPRCTFTSITGGGRKPLPKPIIIRRSVIINIFASIYTIQVGMFCCPRVSGLVETPAGSLTPGISSFGVTIHTYIATKVTRDLFAATVPLGYGIN